MTCPNHQASKQWSWAVSAPAPQPPCLSHTASLSCTSTPSLVSCKPGLKAPVAMRPWKAVSKLGPRDGALVTCWGVGVKATGSRAASSILSTTLLPTLCLVQGTNLVERKKL